MLANQGDADHTGAELSIEWLPTEALELGLKLGYLDAVIKNTGINTLNIFGASVPVAGRRPYAPLWSGALSLAYQVALFEQYSAKINLYYDYCSKFSGSQSTLVEEGIYALPGYGPGMPTLTS